MNRNVVRLGLHRKDVNRMFLAVCTLLFIVRVWLSIFNVADKRSRIYELRILCLKIYLSNNSDI